MVTTVVGSYSSGDEPEEWPPFTQLDFDSGAWLATSMDQRRDINSAYLARVRAFGDRVHVGPLAPDVASQEDVQHGAMIRALVSEPVAESIDDEMVGQLLHHERITTRQDVALGLDQAAVEVTGAVILPGDLDAASTDQPRKRFSQTSAGRRLRYLRALVAKHGYSSIEEADRLHPAVPRTNR